MRNVTAKSAMLLLALAVVGGGGLIRAQVEKAALTHRNVQSVNLA